MNLILKQLFWTIIFSPMKPHHQMVKMLLHYENGSRKILCREFSQTTAPEGLFSRYVSWLCWKVINNQLSSKNLKRHSHGIGVEKMTEYSSAWIKSILKYTLRTQFRTIDSETIIGYQDIHYWCKVNGANAIQITQNWGKYNF